MSHRLATVSATWCRGWRVICDPCQPNILFLDTHSATCFVPSGFDKPPPLYCGFFMTYYEKKPFSPPPHPLPRPRLYVFNLLLGK